MKKFLSFKIFLALLLLLSASLLIVLPKITPSAHGAGPVIVLDPGHAGANTAETDPATGIESKDSSGAPGEMQTMWDTAQIIKSKLETDGYTVVLTKTSESDTAGLVTKVKRANDSNAVLAVSLHYTGDGVFTQTNDHYGVTAQEVGLSRTNNDNGKSYTFQDSNLASKSLLAAQAIVAARNAAGAPAKLSPLDLSFPPNRPDISAWGGISIVQLLAKIPWVYNEAGAIGFDKQKYAMGIANGIEKAVPANGGGTLPGGGGAPGQTVVSNCVVTKVGNALGLPILPATCNTSTGGGTTGQCGSVVDMDATKINPNEQIGSNGLYSILSANQSTQCYTTHSAASKYWCTDSVIDSYNLAGITGLSVAAGDEAVINMHAHFKSLPGYLFIPYPGSLTSVKPGYAFIKEGGSGQHTGIVKTITIDGRGNGSITTLESNSGAKSHTFPIAGGVIQGDWPGEPFVGFGGH